MEKGEAGAGGVGGTLAGAELFELLPEHVQLRGGDPALHLADGEGVEQYLQLNGGAHLAAAGKAAVVIHHRQQHVHAAGLHVVRDESAHAGLHREEALLHQRCDARAHDVAVDAHLLGQLALGGELIADLQLAGEDLVLDLTDEQILEARRFQFLEFHADFSLGVGYPEFVSQGCIVDFLTNKSRELSKW